MINSLYLLNIFIYELPTRYKDEVEIYSSEFCIEGVKHELKTTSYGDFYEASIYTSW